MALSCVASDGRTAAAAGDANGGDYSGIPKVNTTLPAAMVTYWRPSTA